ncbi:hypothetical protein HGRIS_008099 [Hohenbuehelia grisea]
MNNQLAAWSLSGVQNDAWRVHSSLTLPENQPITATDTKSGLLAIGSNGNLSVYTLIMENDLLSWSPKWSSTVPTPSSVFFAPSLMYIASISQNDNIVRIYSTPSGRQTQVIPHPRPVRSMVWRHSQQSSRDDLILYTITSDSTLRIFLPVLDAPQHLQLHASIDLFSSIPYSVASKYPNLSDSAIFPLDREVIDGGLTAGLKDLSDHEEDARTRRLKDIMDEGWDLFMRVMVDGSVIVTAIANIDRRPPTLLSHFTLQQSAPATLLSLPSQLVLLPDPTSRNLTLVTSSPLTSYTLSPIAFFDAHPDGLQVLSRGSDAEESEENRGEIKKLVRTPEGKGVGIIRKSGSGELWRVVDGGTRLVKQAKWKNADFVVVLYGGKTFATYTLSDGSLTLHSDPPSTLTGLPSIISLFSMPSEAGGESIFAVASDHSILHITILGQPDEPWLSPLPEPEGSSAPLSLKVHSHSSLPLSSPPQFIVPVDPMAWGLAQGDSKWVQHDILLSISEDGELAFWVTEENHGGDKANGLAGWRCTGRVRTGRRGVKRVCCSSAKKSGLVMTTPEGDELTIWDSHESEFASGLEYLRHFEGTVNDLDWTSTPDSQSILAVGFLHHVDLLCQQRMTYFDEGFGWALCWRIDISNTIPYQICDSIWLTNGSLLVTAGHQVNLYTQAQRRPYQDAPPENETLFGYVARNNGPLMDYHPQMLLQCLLWGKVELVKDIIVNLAENVEVTKSGQKRREEWENLPVEEFLKTDYFSHSTISHKKGYTFLFNGPDQNESDDEGFSRPLVLRLIENLEAEPLPNLSPNEHAHLLVLIQTTLEIDEQRRALDANGLRYLTSMRSFYILNRRASHPGSPESGDPDNATNAPRHTGRRERLRYRDIIWGFHSESQDLLLSSCTAACNGKMCWSDARALGVAIWLNSVDSMKSQLEIIARNEYMAGDNRDPTACSLYYFALGKVKLVHGLWKQAAWHKEQAVMLKFLSNDFGEGRWRTAALKNAYALLSKRRFEYAAAFFLLGGSLKDAVNVCLKQLADFQLAIALARVVEQSDEGPVLLSILRNTVLPTAFKDGNRWLASWAFWLLHRRDLAVRILVTPLVDIVAVLDIEVPEIGEPHYDDPGLALLFSQLRSKTLQAAQGTSEISSRAEFNFVLQIARVFCRMGCHVLALDLVRSWSFDRPSTVVRDDGLSTMAEEEAQPPSPVSSRRPIFALEPAMRRRSSIMIDIDIPSLPPTRSASPERPAVNVPPSVPEEPAREEGDLFARKAGFGSLMKSAKQDVKIPEFDMGAFF